MSLLGKKRRLSTALQLALLTAGVTGLWATLTAPGMMQGRALLYFTTQSNILAVAVTLLCILWRLPAIQSAPPPWLWRLKYMTVVALALTYLVFHFILMPWLAQTGNGSYYWSLGNLGVHVLTPLLMLLDWALFTPPEAAALARPSQGLLLPLGYGLFTWLATARGLSYAGGSQAPYFFLNIEKNGWFSLSPDRLGVGWWLLIMAALILLVSKAVICLPRQGQQAAG